MAEYTKAELDACTDQAIMTIRQLLPPTFSPAQASYGRRTAAILASQFPDTPDLARIVLACVQNLAPIGDSDTSATYAVCALAAAGLALEEAEGSD